MNTKYQYSNSQFKREAYKKSGALQITFYQ